MTPFLTIAGFAVLGLAAVALQVLGMRSGSRVWPAQTFVAVLMRSTVGRWTVLVLWLWVGWHFFVR